MEDLCRLPATELAGLLACRKLGAEELLDAVLSRIEKTNPRINALVAVDEAAARVAARRADEAMVKGESLGPLHGLPVAIKDLFATKGMTTTYGSPLYKDYVPAYDHLVSARQRAAGAVILGKSNTPEFGSGGQTDNPVYGLTRNPYDPEKSVSGSSGGGTAALACGMVALADGSDLGGSLRSPPAWCNVVGLRPTPGRIPGVPSRWAWDLLSVPGPMARTVADTALFLSVLAGPDHRSPISLPETGETFRRPLDRAFTGCRIAWSLDLGVMTVDPEVAALFEAQRQVFVDLGCQMIDTHPDISQLEEVFAVMRAFRMAAIRGPEVAQDRARVNQAVVADVDHGRRLTGSKILHMEVKRSQLFARISAFFESHDYLVTPANLVKPYPADDVASGLTGSLASDGPVDWRSFSLAPVLGLPAVSVPSGFTSDGMPAGLQITGPHARDFQVLQLAQAYERQTEHWKVPPPLLNT